MVAEMVVPTPIRELRVLEGARLLPPPTFASGEEVLGVGESRCLLSCPLGHPANGVPVNSKSAVGV